MVNVPYYWIFHLLKIIAAWLPYELFSHLATNLTRPKLKNNSGTVEKYILSIEFFANICKNVFRMSTTKDFTAEYLEVRQIAVRLGKTVKELAEMAKVPYGTLNGWRKAFSGSYKQLERLQKVRDLENKEVPKPF